VAHAPSTTDRARTATPLTPHAVRAAVHLYEHGRLTIGQLAANLDVSDGWASRVVNELVTSGMAVREQDPVDRRVVHVSMAPDARTHVESAYRWRSEAIERALRAFDPGERALVVEFLRRTVHELGQGRDLSAIENRAMEPAAAEPPP
jgi:DNA-binding MarR family transcriptional regulator